MQKIKERVIDLIAEVFYTHSGENLEREMVEYVNLVDDLGMDSITFISIVVEIEDAFEIEVEDEMLLMEKFQTVDAIVDIVTQGLQKRSDGKEELRDE